MADAAAPTIVPTTIAPTTTLPCPMRENIFPGLKKMAIFKKVETAAVCKDKCVELEGCQYWAWRHNKKITKGTCRLYAVGWKKSKNTVAGEIC